MTNLIVFSFAFCSPFSGRAGLWLSSQHPPGLGAPLWQQKPQSPASEGCVRTRNPPQLPPQPARPWGREVGARQWGGCSSLELGLPGVRSSPALASQRHVLGPLRSGWTNQVSKHTTSPCCPRVLRPPGVVGSAQVVGGFCLPRTRRERGPHIFPRELML